MVKVSYFVIQSETKMRIVRAAHLGMCFGVRDAIDLALGEVAPLTIFGELAHNQTVLEQLRSRGIRIQTQPEKIATQNVMITAHGASETTLGLLRARGLKVLEATCPLVRYAHASVARLVAEGFHPVIIGQRNHVEVRGLTEDLAEYDVVLTEEDVNGLPRRSRFGIAAQTTQPIDRVRRLTLLIEEKFPEAEVCLVDTVCQPTKQRQAAAIELARSADVVIVVGGSNSNNTRELVATSRRYCARVHPIQSAADLRPAWFEGHELVGLTAGTSTPDAIIDEAQKWLEDFARALTCAG
jgi:4-hydroxy-3-methylbut-2-enyl diphosphate reductase